MLTLLYEQFNIVALRILPFDSGSDDTSTAAVHGSPSQLLRLTAHPSLNDLQHAFNQWQCNRTSLTIRLISDYLIGVVIKTNNQLTIDQTCAMITNYFTNVTDPNEWIYFVYSLLMKLPLSLLGLVFSLIIIPSLESAGIRQSTSWPLDKSDISLPNHHQNNNDNNDSPITYSLLSIFSNHLLPLNTCIQHEHHSQLNDIYLITVIGHIGYQLKWPAYIKYFEENRFQLSNTLGHVIPVNQDHQQRKTNDMPCQLSIMNNDVLPTSISDHVTNDENGDDNLALSCTQLMESSEDKNSTYLTILSNDINSSVNNADESNKHITTAAAGITTTTADLNNTSSDRYQFIEEIRRREFGVGVELSKEAADLVQRVEGKLSRSLVQLSEELYSLPGHFLLELIQNADDNQYHVSDVPTLQLQLCQLSTVSDDDAEADERQTFALLVMNNESIGFTESDMSALCDIGQSTKVLQRDAKIGRKGIGFKSVFNVTNTPEIHSNGFHVRFHRQSSPTSTNSPTDTSSSSLILIPEWCSTTTMRTLNSAQSLPSWCKTLFILPLNSKLFIHYTSLMTAIQSSIVYIIRLIQTTFHPNLMLFLRRLQCLTFSCVEVSFILLVCLKHND
ncbi:unnamed protein product [Schistosoma turkestanicum]|nr:unnamed protein product [Schistosoma turkestanicum]